MSLIQTTCYANRHYGSVESNERTDPKRGTLVPADLLGENKGVQSMPHFMPWIFLLECGELVLDRFLSLLFGLRLPLHHPPSIPKQYLKNDFSLNF